MDSTQSQSAELLSTIRCPSKNGNYVGITKHIPRVGLQLGNYRLVHLLAEGGFAEVYLGEHIHLNTYAAIKILHAQLTQKDLEPFREEARIVAHLRHPHIISILDFDVENGTPFLVMEHAPNGTLRLRHPKGSVLAPATIAEYLLQVADALHYAHSQQLIHRDVKPENMLVSRNNEILLSDFGIAVVTQAAHAEMKHEVIGTVAYMSPEQFRGQALPASDQYSLAIVVYEWLCGRCPFQGSPSEVATQHVYVAPPAIREYNAQISSELEQVVLQALAKAPEQRYSTTLDFARAFEAACPQQTVFLHNFKQSKKIIYSPDCHEDTTTRVASAENARAPKQKSIQQGTSRRSVLLSLAGLSLLGIAGGSLVWSIGSRPYTHPPTSYATPTATPTPVPIGTLYLSYHGHTESVYALSWSPSQGTYLASSGQDHSVHIWYAETGADVRIYTGHSDAVNAVVWSPDAQYIASASADKTVQLWVALREGGPVVTYHGHQDVVNTIAWSPNLFNGLYDGPSEAQYIASAGNDKVVRIWKAYTGEDITIYKFHSAAIRALAWSPDGKYIASAGYDKTVQVWNPTQGNNPPIVTFKGHSSTVNALAWSPDGHYIVSAGADKTVQIWYATPGTRALITYTGHHDSVNSVAWSPDGSRIASASNDGTVRVWNARDGSDLFTYRGHVSGVYSVRWSPNGAYIASCGADKTVQIWYT